eukprot:TRINITY_DN1837_c0_g1_i1.p1 TRINITY_DN1837_c0_g1~~TRINITY_DN1837_c0_g1_i1.p1  ORF type:complete len:303 (-),score=57.49 TRINITY_DN1837_c0_g1_i1:52-960(-)
MGGSYYDREVSSTTTAYSEQATKVLSQTVLHPLLNPFQRPISCTPEQIPLVVAIDVTGSMSNWPKILWDKMPMFYGQVMMKNYIQNPAISFCAIGDAYGDKAPLQVCPFAQGNALDEWISKIYLEGGGSGRQQAHETYELAAFYYSHLFTWEGEPEPEPGTNEPYTGRKGFFFIAADEFFYEELNQNQVCKLILGEQPPPTHSKDVLRKLTTKFHVFLIKKHYDTKNEPNICKQWGEVIGSNHILPLSDPKAIVDIMLGILAIHPQGKNMTMDQYEHELRERGQTDERIAVVRRAFQNYKKE